MDGVGLWCWRAWDDEEREKKRGRKEEKKIEVIFWVLYLSICLS